MSDENAMLQNNLRAQLERLSQQYKDLENSRGDMNDEEYNELQEDTLEQLKEFTKRLSKAIAGDTTIHSDLNNFRLASSEAITKSFQTPSIAKMFAENKPDALKDQRYQIERDMKSGKLSLEVGNRQKLEVLSALKSLGCELTDNDKTFIRNELKKLHSCVPSNGSKMTDKLDYNMLWR